MDRPANATPAPRPRDAMDQMINGFRMTYAIHAAATLGVADLLADGPRPCVELAEATGARAPLLRRLLCLLASAGVFAEVEPGVFGLTPEAELLRDTPGSLRNAALFWGELGTLAWRDLVGVVRTGQTGYQLVTGMREWDYYVQNPSAGALFNATMTDSSQASADAIVAAYDFPSAGTVVDVAGGHGTLIAAILRARPGLCGVLFDAPHVVTGADALLEAAGVADRCRVVGGDFFKAVPDGGDLYTMKWIVHDWDDERAGAILRNCRKAVGERGTLLVIDRVMPSGTVSPSPAFAEACRADVNMMAWTGGQERTAEEFGELLGSTGFHLTRIVPTAGPLSLIEAIPA